MTVGRWFLVAIYATIVGVAYATGGPLFVGGLVIGYVACAVAVFALACYRLGARGDR